MSISSATGRVAPLRDILAYATGDGVNSLVMNSMGFAMLYYTEALGVDYRLAALAISAATLWNALTEPLMGHITDNTRCRFGRRHPYMLFGGVFTAVCFFLMWTIPQPLRAPHLLLGYVIVINLLLRTGLTVFAVPHGALGFEICTDYTQRTTLQGMRVGFNMLINLAGPAMAWAIFFADQEGVESTKVASNYVRMGRAFSIVATAFVLLVVFATRRYMADTRPLAGIVGSRPREVLRNIRDVITDKCPRPVFLFVGIVFVGMSLVASLEMYVYVHFMEFSSNQRAVVHGAGMVACGLGGLFSPLLVRRLDKKIAVCLAVLVVAGANGVLCVLFAPGVVAPQASWRLFDGLPGPGGRVIPIAMLIFLVFHALYWAGNGILTPIAGSMIADASEIWRFRTGVLKDGSYSAMLSCITKVSMSLGLLLSGCCLDWVGFVVGSEKQSPQAVRNLAVVTFLGGAAIALVAMLALLKYSVTRDEMRRIKRALAG
jgi:glycoside/pentoside/hexuronide:cation symporter, GPH family